MLNESIEKIFFIRDKQGFSCELHFASGLDVLPSQFELMDVPSEEDQVLFDASFDFQTNLDKFLNMNKKLLHLFVPNLFNAKMKKKLFFDEQVFKEEDFIVPKSGFELTEEGLLEHFKALHASRPPSRIHPDGTFTARKPDGAGVYVQLSLILEEAFKEPTYDTDGYADYRWVFSKDTSTISLEWYNLVTFDNTLITSRLYHRYLDEKSIIFREYDQQFLWYEPAEGESIAVKYSGLSAFRVKKEFAEKFDLEYVYLMLREPEFSKQFPGPVTIKHILSGWIPEIDFSKQKE
jgi:hypothetical protein